MTRIPRATFEGYEEPVAASGSALQVPPSTTRHHKKDAAAFHFPLVNERKKATPSPLRRSADVREDSRASGIDGSPKLSEVKHPEEYPRIALKKHHDSFKGSAEVDAYERSKWSLGRTCGLVFGIGSHGLHDRSAARLSVREDGVVCTNQQEAPAGCAVLPPAVKTSTPPWRTAKDASKTSNKGLSGVLPLPRIAPQSAAAGQKVKATKTLLPTPILLPAAARVMRHGGVIDAFSYFSVHRVYPELYSHTCGCAEKDTFCI
ncbi:hypothetical protein ABL78_5978 [Leptomonas seymouri]|uniref:Uncharacterized protein n=1 Tax=Leptomonas seymouri TaxID=5684 RepID=A0A0N1I1G8_LEPSE|nr:hypothetical protein ABL78_5978 [Leptomonas seymouri]|eukprot:KPI84963.1 hypothetical protein ABL78_5978 [Leptomonas seymouri]